MNQSTRKSVKSDRGNKQRRSWWRFAPRRPSERVLAKIIREVSTTPDDGVWTEQGGFWTLLQRRLVIQLLFLFLQYVRLAIRKGEFVWVEHLQKSYMSTDANYWKLVVCKHGDVSGGVSCWKIRLSSYLLTGKLARMENLSFLTTCWFSAKASELVGRFFYYVCFAIMSVYVFAQSPKP